MAGPSGTTSRLLLPFPTPDDDVDAPRDVKALADKLDEVGLIPTAIPVGAIMMWSLGTAPTGWLLCDGAVVSDTYPKLKALMANVPDLRTRVPVGVGTGAALGAVGGAASVVLADGNTPVREHDHHLQAINAGGAPPVNSTAPSVNGGTKSIALGGTAAGSSRVMPLPVSGQYYYGLQVGGVAGSKPAVSAHENMPPFVVLNFIICAG